jgi:hypothetical protein
MTRAIARAERDIRPPALSIQCTVRDGGIVRALFATLGFAVLCGCGAHPATVQGTYAGAPFTVGDTISGSTFTVGGDTVTEIVVDGATISCDRATRNQLSKNSRSLAMFVYTSTALSPGTFHLGSASDTTPPFVDAQVNDYDGSCQRTAVVAIDGSVTVTQADTHGVSGAFDFTFDEGHLTGSFSAASCDALQSASSSSETCL